MKSVTLCIFAHPDDEAFGPSGSIALLAQTEDVYLVCVTDGNDPSISTPLANIRRKELLASAEVLGIKEVYFLNYPDGGLCNSVYHEVAEKIQTLATKLQAQRFLTFEPRGVSGHLDHIALAMISSFIFERQSFVEELWYFCLSQEERELISSYFIYFPPGYALEAVDKVMDVSSVWSQKVSAIACHLSQKKDGDLILDMKTKLPKEELFLIKRKI